MTTLHQLVGKPQVYEDDDLDEINVLDERGESVAQLPYKDERSRVRAMALALALVAAIECTAPADPVTASVRRLLTGRPLSVRDQGGILHVSNDEGEVFHTSLPYVLHPGDVGVAEWEGTVVEIRRHEDGRLTAEVKT